MKWSIFFVMISTLFFSQSTNIDEIRKNYQKSVNDKKLCKEMLRKMETDDNFGIKLAYFGALQSIWAKHANNPIEKLKSFKKGTKNIDQSIKQQPNNVEARLIRYTIQKQSPGFLGYRSNMNEDKQLLQDAKKTVTDPFLKEMITQILKI